MSRCSLAPFSRCSFREIQMHGDLLLSRTARVYPHSRYPFVRPRPDLLRFSNRCFYRRHKRFRAVCFDQLVFMRLIMAVFVWRGVGCVLTLICSNVVWLADTNYRIDLDNGLVRGLAAQDDYDALLAADQVRLQYDCALPHYTGPVPQPFHSSDIRHLPSQDPLTDTRIYS